MSQRRIKKALMLWAGIRTKEYKTLFKVRGKPIKGLWSAIGKYRIKLIPGRRAVTFLGVPIEGIKKNFKCYEK